MVKSLFKKESVTFPPDSNFVLFEGDCLDLLSELPDNVIQLAVTSPPYNIGKPYETRLDLEQYIHQQELVIRECVRVLKPEGNICWQVGNYVDNGRIVPLDIVLFPVFSSLGLKLRNRIVWHFGHGLHASKRFSGRYEVVLWFTKSENYVFNLDSVRIPQKYPQKRYFKGPKKGELSGNPLGKNPSDVWDIPNVKANHIEKTEHPAQFPVELIERLILSMTNEGDWVLDPFLGSGTSAIAALMHNRKAIGSEIMKEYIKIIKERVALAEKGDLQIRPMERAVYNPASPEKNLPPKKVKISQKEPVQPELLSISEPKRRYGK
jgi:adenine-specific DNA-methyltransferase